MMKSTSNSLRTLASVIVAITVLAAPSWAAASTDGGPSLAWQTVVDNDDTMPGTVVRFNSYNQPSVNADGVVVLRARSRGPQPMHGIYVRDMGSGGPAALVMDRSTAVPAPNNTGAMLVEFPSFPRIDLTSPAVVSRAQSPPAWSYTLSDGSETVAGTSGIFTTGGGSLRTGLSLLGAVPGFDHFAVPGVTPTTRFDVFPGAPAIADGSVVVFKGNYTDDGVAKTGAFYRDVADPDASVVRLAATGTPIPGGRRGATFGEVGPPSAALGAAVFVAWDDEQDPTAGGIYLARLRPDPKLRTLVSLGSRVPGQPGKATFRQFGEGLSFDGRYVAFWASWGSETRQVTLYCPDEGNAQRRAYCLEHDNGAVREVPVHQGIFVYDVLTEQITPVAATGGDVLDFQYWNYSGHPPGNGEGEEEPHEPPAWRSSAFVSASASPVGFHVAFKATTTAAADRLYLAAGPRRGTPVTLVETLTTPASTFSPGAPPDAVVTSIGIERDSFRNGWLAVTASMTDGTEEGTAGVYVARVP